jgi:hypothetical protein
MIGNPPPFFILAADLRPMILANINTEELEGLAVRFRNRTDFRKCKSLRTCSTQRLS